VALSFIVTLVVISALFQAFSTTFLLTTNYSASNCITSNAQTEHRQADRRIAIIDELGASYPNPQFVSNITSTAEKAGYAVDYYPPRNVTINLFLNLPSRDYSMIILRTHGSGRLTDPPTIVTSETYTTSQRVADQLFDRLTSVEVTGGRFFAITSGFITNDMCGRFPGTLILGMWCASTHWASLASAFIEKGARGYIGWDNLVTVYHTDLVFELVANLLLGGQTASQSVQIAMNTVGQEPSSGARLLYYPAN